VRSRWGLGGTGNYRSGGVTTAACFCGWGELGTWPLMTADRVHLFQKTGLCYRMFGIFACRSYDFLVVNES